MRRFIRIIFAMIFLFGCRQGSKEKTTIDKISKSSAASGKQFFEYDQIDHYSSDHDQSQNMEVYDNRSRNEIDSLKFGVLFGDIPEKVNDLHFINKLDEAGFKKAFVDKSKFASIDSLFREKTVENPIWLACIHVFRDVLIFKKQDKVVGIAKICFSCMGNQITGTTANTENFGQEGDYQRLKDILY